MSFMSSKKPLRAVSADEKPPKPEAPKKITDAADDGERALLISLRSHLAREMDKGAVPAHALASVSSKIREYDREIRAIDSRDEQEVGKRGPVGDEAWQAI